MPFLIDPRVIDLRREFHLCVVADKANKGDRYSRVSEIGRRATEAKIGMSMMSLGSLRGGCAERVWNLYYRRCFEWEVSRQIKVEVKRPPFVRAVGLEIVSVSKRHDTVLG